MSEINSVSDLRDQWHALQLEVLTPAALTDEQFAAILHARQVRDQLGPFPKYRAAIKYLRPFYRAAGITVARIKEGSSQDICEYIKSIPDLCATVPDSMFVGASSNQIVYGSYRPGSVKKFIRSLRQDMDKIHSCLFDLRLGGSPIESVGLYKRARVAALHADDDDSIRQSHSVIYLMRLHALPFETIHGSSFASLSFGERMLVRLARNERSILRGFSAVSRGVLRRRHILKKAALGDVVLLAGGPEGTLHCSSPVPRGGVGSGFFSYFGKVANIKIG